MDEMMESSDEEPGPIARMPTDELMNSEVAILTGGRDQQGRQLITLPARHHGILESKVKATGLGRILRYFMESTRASDQKKGFGYVTDLRFANVDFVSMLKSSLSSIQAEMRSTVGVCVMYGIQPINKKTCKDTLTLLNLRKSKKKQNKYIAQPLFQIIMATDEMDLYNFIDRSHLTPDLGGYLQYSHHEWLKFRKVVEPFFVNYESLETRLPSGYERLINLSQQRAHGNSKEELQGMLMWLRDQYTEIRSDVNLEPVSDLCDSLQARFTHSENDPVFGPMAQKPIFRETKSMVTHCHRQLTAAEKRLEALWEGASGKIQQTIDLMTYNDQVKQLQDWFAQKGRKELKRKLEIADSLSKAELLCNHFDTGINAKAKAKLAQADGLIQHAETMVVEQHNPNIVGIMNSAKQLKQQVAEFRIALSKRSILLHKVYDFFFVYEKAAKWVTQVLKFLPDDLIDLFSSLQGNKKRQDNSRSKDIQWHEDVKRFLRRNLPPTREELAKARKAADVIPENKAKKQGRVLVHRCLVLLRILNLKEVASMRDVIEAVKWQGSLLSDNPDVPTAGKKEPKQATPPSESSWTSREADVRRLRPPPGKGKARMGVSEKDRKKDDSGLRNKSTKDKSDRRLEMKSNGFDKPDRNQPVRDLYTGSASPGAQRFMQRPVYLPGGNGQEVHAVPTSAQQATLSNDARLNGSIPGRQQDLHNQSFGVYGESSHDGGISSNGYGYTNGPSLYPLGEIPQGLPAHHLPGNRYHSSQDYSIFPQNAHRKPSASSPNSHTLSPPGHFSREPSPIRSPDMPSIYGKQQSPPMRLYKSMIDVRQPLNEETGTLTRNPPNFESTGHQSLRSHDHGHSAWLTNLQHGQSEPVLDQLVQNTTSSPYNDVLENLSSLKVQHDNVNPDSHGSYDYDQQMNKIDTNQPNSQTEYYQRLLGADRSDLGHLSSERFHDRSPYDLSILSARKQLQQQQRSQARHRLPPRKIPPMRNTYIDERTPPELLDHAGALPPSMTPLDILEYELAADKEYLAEEIADEKYRMEKEHQAMIDSLFSEQFPDEELGQNHRRPYYQEEQDGRQHISLHESRSESGPSQRARVSNPEEELGQNHRRLYDHQEEQDGFHHSSSHDRRSESSPSQRAGVSNPTTSTSRIELLSPPGTPPLPEILSSPPHDSGDDNWNLYPAGAYGTTPLTMRELDELDDTRVPSRRPGEQSGLLNGHSLAPLTDRLKEYFEDGEPSQPLEYEKLLEEAQRNREESQEVLKQEMNRYNDVLMHREELTQQDLQDRLYKIEEKLQEEEAIMKQEQELDYLMEIERRRDYASHKHAPHHNYDLSHLHLSDEGVIFDGGSMDEGYDHASTITTERESVESGLGLRRSRSGGSQSVFSGKDKSDTKTSLKVNSTTSNGPKHYHMNGHANQMRENPNLLQVGASNAMETQR